MVKSINLLAGCDGIADARVLVGAAAFEKIKV
jgi:hypothetical protein